MGALFCGLIDQASAHDCTAHSALFSPGSNKVRPLFVYTDTWCSSGQFDGNGMLVQTGGDADGVKKVMGCHHVVTYHELALAQTMHSFVNSFMTRCS